MSQIAALLLMYLLSEEVTTKLINRNACYSVGDPESHPDADP